MAHVSVLSLKHAWYAVLETAPLRISQPVAWKAILPGRITRPQSCPSSIVPSQLHRSPSPYDRHQPYLSQDNFPPLLRTPGNRHLHHCHLIIWRTLAPTTVLHQQHRHDRPAGDGHRLPLCAVAPLPLHSQHTAVPSLLPVAVAVALYGMHHPDRQSGCRHIPSRQLPPAAHRPRHDQALYRVLQRGMPQPHRSSRPHSTKMSSLHPPLDPTVLPRRWTWIQWSRDPPLPYDRRACLY